MTIRDRLTMALAQLAMIEAQIGAVRGSIEAMLASLDAPRAPGEPAACTAPESRSLRTFKTPNAYQCAAGHVHGQEPKTEPEATPPQEGKE